MDAPGAAQVSTLVLTAGKRISPLLAHWRGMPADEVGLLHALVTDLSKVLNAVRAWERSGSPNGLDRTRERARNADDAATILAAYGRDRRRDDLVAIAETTRRDLAVALDLLSQTNA